MPFRKNTPPPVQRPKPRRDFSQQPSSSSALQVGLETPQKHKIYSREVEMPPTRIDSFYFQPTNIAITSDEVTVTLALAEQEVVERQNPDLTLADPGSDGHGETTITLHPSTTTQPASASIRSKLYANLSRRGQARRQTKIDQRGGGRLGRAIGKVREPSASDHTSAIKNRLAATINTEAARLLNLDHEQPPVIENVLAAMYDDTESTQLSAQQLDTLVRVTMSITPSERAAQRKNQFRLQPDTGVAKLKSEDVATQTFFLNPTP